MSYKHLNNNHLIVTHQIFKFEVIANFNNYFCCYCCYLVTILIHIFTYLCTISATTSWLWPFFFEIRKCNMCALFGKMFHSFTSSLAAQAPAVVSYAVVFAWPRLTGTRLVFTIHMKATSAHGKKVPDQSINCVIFSTTGQNHPTHMFIMQTIRKWVECNKVITCHCSYLFVCLYFCIHFCISEHLCACVCLCLCVYAYMRAISAASMSCGVSESPEALAANSFPVKALPYLMIHERVKQQWKPAHEVEISLNNTRSDNLFHNTWPYNLWCI